METLPDWALKEMEEERDSIAQNLHLVSFRKELRTHEAESALAQLGLTPASLTETLLFLAIYGDNIQISPILALNAYHDLSGSLESIFKSYSRPPKYGLCLCIVEGSLAQPGNTESSEALRGATFFSGTHFLCKRNPRILDASNTEDLPRSLMTTKPESEQDKYPLTTQKGLSVEGQKMIDSFNHDQLVELQQSGGTLEQHQEDILKELKAKLNKAHGAGSEVSPL